MTRWKMFCHHCKRRWTAFTAEGDEPSDHCVFCLDGIVTKEREGGKTANV